MVWTFVFDKSSRSSKNFVKSTRHSLLWYKRSSYRIICVNTFWGESYQNLWNAVQTGGSCLTNSYHSSWTSGLSKCLPSIDYEWDDVAIMLKREVMQSRGFRTIKMHLVQSKSVNPILSGKCVLTTSTDLSKVPSPSSPMLNSWRFSFLLMSQSDPVKTPVICSQIFLSKVLPLLGYELITIVGLLPNFMN